MSIRVQIGYPDYILDKGNRRLDEEYSKVRSALARGPSITWGGKGRLCQ